MSEIYNKKDNNIVVKNERLKHFITSENISQKEFAEKIDSTQQYVSALLNGKRKLGSNILERIEQGLNVNVNWLLTGEGSMLKDAETVSKLEDPAATYEVSDLKAMHQDLKKDLKSLEEGMIMNFEVISKGLMQSLMGQQKLLDFTEKLDANKIKKSTEALDDYLKQMK